MEKFALVLWYRNKSLVAGQLQGGHIIGLSDDDTGSSTKTRTISVTWVELGLEAGISMQVRDLWAKKDIGEFTGSFSAEVQFHEALIFAFEES